MFLLGNLWISVDKYSLCKSGNLCMSGDPWRGELYFKDYGAEFNVVMINVIAYSFGVYIREQFIG